jgi:hypothetical protein
MPGVSSGKIFSWGEAAAEDRLDLHIAEKGYFGLISSEMKIFCPAGVYF